jgi:hypothetical protein
MRTPSDQLTFAGARRLASGSDGLMSVTAARAREPWRGLVPGAGSFCSSGPEC